MTSVYIGPYLVIPPSQVASTSQKRVCAKNCEMPRTGADKFCGNCGGAVFNQAVTTQEMRPLPIERLARKWTDYMFRPEYGQNHPAGDIWLPNRSRYGLTIRPGDEDSFKPCKLDDLVVKGLLGKAMREYAEFVAALRADFGFDPFWEVGLFVYSS